MIAVMIFAAIVGVTIGTIVYLIYVWRHRK